MVQDDSPTIINVYGQFYMGLKNCDQDNPILRIKWIKKALNQIIKDIPPNKTISLPHKIGCLTEGGDWKKYETCLKKFEKKYYKKDKKDKKDKIDNKKEEQKHLLLCEEYEFLNHSWKNNDKLTIKDKSWNVLLQQIYKMDEFKELEEFLKNQIVENKIEIYPLKQHVFRTFELCSLQNVKVVILGQDCYHGPNQAHGLAFSVQPGIPQPPSLRNIFRELHEDEDTDFKNKTDGDLSHWVKQGVILLNSALTVEQSKPGSHLQKWMPITDYIIKYLSDECDFLIFLLWGNFAKKKKNLLIKKNIKY